MAAIVNNTAHVLILRTHDVCKVVSGMIGNTLSVRVFISETTIRNELNNFRSLLPRFAIDLSGYNVQRFEIDNVPDRITEVFRFVCRQINNNVPLRGIMDDYGRFLISTGVSSVATDNQSTIQPQNIQQPNTQFQQAASAVFNALATGQQDRSQWQRIVTDLGGALLSMGQAQAQAPIQAQGPPQAPIQTQVYSPQIPAQNPIYPNQSNLISSMVGSMYSNNLQNQNMQNPNQPQNQTQNIPRMPVQPNTADVANRNMIGLITQLGQIASMVSRDNSVGQSPQIQQGQPQNQQPQNPTMQPNQNQPVLQNQRAIDVDSPYLQRFVENRVGATREIIPIIEQPTDVNHNLQDADAPNTQNQPLISQSQQNTPVVGLQRVTQERKEVPISTIARLAVHINAKLTAGKVKAPSFISTSRTNYKKIKNFVHHHTKVWLSKGEVDTFISEMSKINPRIANATLDIQLD